MLFIKLRILRILHILHILYKQQRDQKEEEEETAENGQAQRSQNKSVQARSKHTICAIVIVYYTGYCILENMLFIILIYKHLMYLLLSFSPHAHGSAT